MLVFELTDPPFERPRFISRDYLLGLLRDLCVRLAPEDVLSPMLEYLVGVGVVSRDGDQHFLAANRDALFEPPPTARRALLKALLGFAKTPRCPGILGYVFPADREFRIDLHLRRGEPDYAAVASDLRRNRAAHVASLHEFGTAMANRIVDHVIERQLRLASPSASTSSNVVSREPPTSMRDDENQAAAANEQMQRLIAVQIERFEAPTNLLNEMREQAARIPSPVQEQRAAIEKLAQAIERQTQAQQRATQPTTAFAESDPSTTPATFDAGTPSMQDHRDGDPQPPTKRTRLQKPSSPASKASPVDLAIDGYRAAHRVWDAAIPHVGASITAIDAKGDAFKIEYWLPSSEPLQATTDDEFARFGFAKPDWSSLRQPVLPPTDEEWRAAYDACRAARRVLAHAADQLAAAVDGTDNSSRQLRASSLRLATMLRDVPPVWPTKTETDLAFAINNTRIVEYRQAVAEARHRREAAEAAATEERRKQKAERLADLMIEWHGKQRPKRTTLPTGERRQPRERARRRNPPRKGLSDMAALVLRALPSSSEPALRTLNQIAAKVGTSPQPSQASVSRAVRELRSTKPQLVDKVSYRRTKAGDAAHRLA